MRPNERFPSLDKLIKHHRTNRGHLATILSTVPSRRHSSSMMAAFNLFHSSPNIPNHHQQQQHHQQSNPSIPPPIPAKQKSKSLNLDTVNVTRSNSRIISPLAIKENGSKSWEIKASELQLLEELGSGQFGVVRHGKWKGRIDVAVKLMKEGTMSERDFIEEAKVMTQLQHSNLVKLYGLCIEHRPICIVAEFMKHGMINYHILYID